MNNMALPLNVLVLEDEPGDVDLVLHELTRSGFEVRWRLAGSRDSYLAELHPDLDVILADYTLPQFNAREALALLQESGLDIPFIVVAGSVSEEVVVECMKQGAADYILKDRLIRLSETVKRALADKRTREEKRQADRLLRESEERLRTVLENMPVMLDALDENLNIIVWNRECERVTGYSKDEIINHPNVSELLYPNPQYREQMQAKLAVSDDYRDWEWETTCKDGSVRTIAWSNISRKYPVPGWARWGIGVDVTDRKRAEEALKKRVKEIDLLYRASQRLSAPLELPAVYETIVGIIRELMDCDWLAISSYDDVSQMIRCVCAVDGATPIDVSQMPPLPLAPEGKGNQSTVIRIGEPLYLPNYQQMRRKTQTAYEVRLDSQESTVDEKHPHAVQVLPLNDRSSATSGSNAELDNSQLPKSLYIVPLKHNDRVIGTVQVQSYREDTFSEDNRRILETLVSQMATVISNARLIADLEAERASLEQRVIERTAQLNRTKERIEAILNSSSDAIVLCNTDGLIDQVNPAFDQAFKFASEEVFNQPISLLVVPEHRAMLEQAFVAVVQRRQPQRLELTALCRGGDWFDADLALSPIIRDDIQMEGVVCSVRDITKRKTMEAQLRQMLEREMELGELKSRYMSMAAHDLRNPLAAIQAKVDVLDKYYHRLSDEERRSKYTSIRRSVAEMVELLNDTLTLGKVEAGKLQFEPGPLNLIQFAQDLIAELRQAMGSTQRIELSHAGACENVYLDAKLLRHILGNLLSNAIKYSPATGTITLDMRCDRSAVTIRIQDQGIGIPAADQKRLFEAFYRAGNVGSVPGTGLGLAIVKQSVELHGGKITLASEEGAGTIFTIVFPQPSIQADGDI